MKTRRVVHVLGLLAASGCAAVASAQQNGGVVNISGATLLENWSRSAASTNDYIDLDGDGIAGYLGTSNFGIPDQLAVGGPSGSGVPGSINAQELVIQYRVTGSINGLRELLRFGAPIWVTADSFGDSDGILGAPVVPPANGLIILGADIDGPPIVNPGQATTAYHNRVIYITGTPVTGQATGAYNQGNPGGAPNRANQTTYRATFSAPPSLTPGGIQIDVSPLDVSTFLAVTKAGQPKWDRRPADGGYGLNPRNSVNKQGGVSGANLSSQLVDISGITPLRTLNEPFTDLNGNGQYDVGEPFVDSNQNGTREAPVAGQTIFDTNLLFAAICPVVNYGTGITQVTITELQWLFGTGRAASGENFIVITRDVGSGTRNAFQNCIGQDPSWGNGDNIGPRSSGTQNLLGSLYIPTNKNGNGDVEATVTNTRLGIGYVGTERGVSGSGSGSWLTRNAFEIADVKNDIYGGTQFVRPTAQNLLKNSANGWVIGGQAVIATIGDPRANGPALGGTGWPGAFDPFQDLNDNGVWDAGEPFTDLNGNGVRDASNAEAGNINNNPPMANPFAAGYLNNISRSIAAFDTVPADVENFGMPGEFAATQFLSLVALDNVRSDADYTQLIPNPDLNQRVQDYVINPANGNVHHNPRFVAFNNAPAGQVPTRATGTVYTDGVPNGNSYINQAGATISYGGSTLALRNKIAGDFDGNGVRSSADAADMLRALRQREGGPAWIAPNGIYGAGAGDTAIIEVLGDFNGDGNFDRADVRYWADGLVLINGQLDRKAGFTAVDAAWQTLTGSNNLFGTTKATGAAYAAGDSRADVWNSEQATTRGFAPIGHDGGTASPNTNDNTIDCWDLTYVFKQFKQNAFVTDGEANWDNLDEAVGFDLSADINGDLKVNEADIDEILAILGTNRADVNLDGVCDEADLAIVQASISTPPASATWCNGDLNGDGVVNQADLDIVAGCINVCPPCAADFNGDDGVDDLDIAAFFAAFESGEPCADVNGDDGIDDLDISFFFSAFEAGC